MRSSQTLSAPRGLPDDGEASELNSTDQLRARLADIADSEEYKVQHVISEITEDVVARMTVSHMSRQDLANELGVSPAMVTKLLRGQNNFTVRTLVQMATALGCNVSVKMPPCGFRTVPFFIGEDTADTTDDSDSAFIEDGWTVAKEVA